MEPKYFFKLATLICLFVFGQIASAQTDYSEFSKAILKNEIYTEYKSEADAGNIKAIINKVADKPDDPNSEYVELTKRIIKAIPAASCGAFKKEG